MSIRAKAVPLILSTFLIVALGGVLAQTNAASSRRAERDQAAAQRTEYETALAQVEQNLGASSARPHDLGFANSDSAGLDGSCVVGDTTTKP